MDIHLLPKKPKLEDNGVAESSSSEEEESSIREQEEALIALIDHRMKEVEQLKQRAAYYQSQAETAEKRLQESHSQLARLRGRSKAAGDGRDGGGRGSTSEGSADVNVVQVSSEPRTQSQWSKPLLVIPSINHKLSTVKAPAAAARSKPAVTSLAAAKAPEKLKRVAAPDLSSDRVTSETEKRSKRKLAEKEHQDLILSVRKSSSPHRLMFQSGSQISSQHKRKLRCLVLSPVDDRMLVTSALDGVVNLWQVDSRRSSATLLSSTECSSLKQRRWPEDIAWHPDGDSIFAAYSADGGDSQISLMNLNLSGDKKVSFLEGKPHVKGIINCIIFMPWSDICFATGGSDHAVMLWSEKNDTWKPKAIHRTQHSSAVMGVAGLQQKKIILSAGSDKRVLSFDVSAGRSELKYQMDSRCMSVLPNPCDFNLFMVQTGSLGKQIRLFDIRLRQTEIHAFGWKQESSDSQSALINQAWSPDGLYLSSGTVDPMIHIFDIRYNASSPSQSVQAHQKRVFKAVWHHSFPMLTSISSDLNIGFHKIS
ncbi:Histone-binding protein MSI1 [Apostasia shenzhenica]|uniref:Histone-binding protein MSI1 n=1 Tax=Apostasia shenzhenica TaxID=1088818 RepID=A0A2I0AUQ3_9ASPA|nr:Histone-binding protein MSI1 [Apostasia shenzhenica]